VPETARLVRQVVSAWLQKALQLPLPLDGCYQYST
jgi:hypothetical protein